MRAYQRPKHEVADIINLYGKEYIESRKLPVQHLKVLHAISACRTHKLGGHVDECGNCKERRHSYNSCRNRHCPKCQGMNQLKWIDDRTSDLLPVRYFHMVFTIPSELNHLCLTNQKLMYDILFKSCSDTLKMLCKDEKHLGAVPSITMVLHTWGQQLVEHPHIHVIISAGGKTENGSWKPSRKKFFIPVQVLSAVFKGKFLSELKSAKKSGRLKLYGKSKTLETPKEYQQFLDVLYEKSWVVFAKKPFRSTIGVLRYLGRYTHRIAISNHRIKSVENGKVTFTYKDYRENGKQKRLTLNSDEFIRRFLMHVLPKRFSKIRHYGIIASRSKNKNLKEVRCKMGASSPLPKQPENWQERLLRLTGFSVKKCVKCNQNTMDTIFEFKGEYG